MLSQGIEPGSLNVTFSKVIATDPNPDSVLSVAKRFWMRRGGMRRSISLMIVVACFEVVCWSTYSAIRDNEGRISIGHLPIALKNNYMLWYFEKKMHKERHECKKRATKSINYTSRDMCIFCILFLGRCKKPPCLRKIKWPYLRLHTAHALDVWYSNRYCQHLLSYQK